MRPSPIPPPSLASTEVTRRLLPTRVDYRFRIARRYLFSSKRVSVISVITALSTVGVAVGVAALIVVLSVMNGFYGFARDLLVSLDPHVRVTAVGGMPQQRADSVLSLVVGMEGVVVAATYAEGKALVVPDGPLASAQSANKIVVVRGVDAGAFMRDSSASGASPQSPPGGGSLAREPGKLPGVSVGGGLSSRIGLVAGAGPYDGSTLGLLSAPAIERAITSPFAPPGLVRFEVRDVFDMDPAYDESHVFVDLQEAQRLFRMNGEVTGVELRLADLERAQAVADEVRVHLARTFEGDESFVVETWYDLNRAFYDVMALEKWGAGAILSLIVIVSAFNIAGSLMMIVIEKRRDVGVLAAMGVPRAGIRHLFLIEGALIGLVGAGGGLVLGLGLALAQTRWGFAKLQSGGGAFLLDAYPVDVQAGDVLVVVAGALVLCLAAALYPARRAAALSPAEAVSLA